MLSEDIDIIYFFNHLLINNENNEESIKNTLALLAKK